MRIRPRDVPILLALVGVAGCATHGAPASAKPTSAGPGAEAPSRPVIASQADLEAAMARENGNLRPAQVASDDWKLEALAAGPVSIVSQNGAPAVSIPIGAEIPVRCILMPRNSDLMNGLSSGLASVQEQSHGTLKKVVPSPIFVAQEAPAMVVSAVFGTGAQVSWFQFAVHAHPQHPVICLHQGLGFLRTFIATATHVFETLQRGQPATPPQLVEIFRINVDGLDWGFSRLAVDKNAGAAWLQDTETRMLIPRSATEFASQTESSEELIDGRGRLVRGAWAKGTGQTLVHKLLVAARDKKGGYDVQGELGGKPLKGELHSRDPRAGIASSLAATLRLRGLAAKPGALDIEQDEYVPAVDPQGLVETRYVRAKGDAGGALRIITPQRELAATVDADGRLREFTMKDGASTVHVERIFTRGKL